MPHPNPNPDPAEIRRRALARWENEGGAPLVETPQPYKSTPVFDEQSLPDALRREHRTKAGVWGIIRVLEGRLRYRVLDPASDTILDPDHPGLVLPDQPHMVEPLGAMRMQVEFYDSDPGTPRP